MIRYAIVDDEPIAHGIIEKFAQEINTLEKVGNCYDAFQAIDLLQRKKLDLLFLDINMPKLSGFEMLKTLKNPPKIIVTTAYKEFALEGYELQVVDYLLKPFSFSRFLKAINIVLDFEVNSPKSIKGLEKHIIVKVDNKKHFILLKDIKYIEAKGNYSSVVTKVEKLLTLRKISDFRVVLPEQFVRVHHSFIVNINAIAAIEGNRIFLGNDVIPIGRTYKRNINL